jgi:hypothetical protein
MFLLLKTEFLRYRNRALLLMLAHLALLGFLNAAGVNLNAAPGFPMWLMSCLATAFGFGVLQMSAHKRSNHWIYLLQRPLPPWQIGTALVLAGAALIILVLVLPFVLNLVIGGLSPAQGIELRHYLQMTELVPSFLLAYLYACFLALYTHKLKYLGFAAVLMLINNIPGVDVPLILLLLGVIAFWCYYSWFKPDLSAGARQPLFIVLSELPLHYGLFWLVMSLHGQLQLASWALLGNGPLAQPVPGSVLEIGIRPDRELMLAGLEGATHAETNFFRQQIMLGEVVPLRLAPPATSAVPVRHQRPSRDRALILENPAEAEIWRFSHDDMLYRGYSERTDAELGWLGPQGFTGELTAATPRFAGIPAATGNRFIVDERILYQIDWERRLLRPKLDLAALDPEQDNTVPERFNDFLGVYENFATLLSDRNLYIFRSHQLDDFDEALTIESRLPLPEAVSWRHSIFSRFHVLELIDGYLVSILIGFNPNETEGNFLRFSTAAHLLYETSSNEYTLLNSRELSSGFSTAQIYEGFVLAPGFRILNDLMIAAVFDTSSAETWSFMRHRFPPLVLLLAFCSMGASGLIVYRLLRPVNLPLAAKSAWVAISAFSGLIGLASFWFGTYRNGLVLQVRVDAPQQLAHAEVEPLHA